MKMVVGLGNPGRQYEQTRHNVGFMTLDILGGRFGAPKATLKKKAFVAQIAITDRAVLLVKPQTFMNDSGDAVGPLCHFYKLQPSDVLIISDDVDLPFGRLRLRERGSAGGHNGLRSIFAALGTQEIPRLRIGVGRSHDRDTRDHVLAAFSREDAADLPDVLAQAADAVERVVRDGIVAAMNSVNPGDASTVPPVDPLREPRHE